MADEKLNEEENEGAGGASADAEALEERVVHEPADVPVDEPVAEEPTADVETTAPAAEDASEEPAAEAAPEEPAAEKDATEAEPDTGPSSASAEPKRKKKRLPRSERPKRTRPKRVPSTERKPMVRLEKPDHERGRRQERQGKVVSDAMEKTIVVRVDVVKAHPRYKKVVRRSVKFHAHDETSQAKVGDIVRIVETRPLSKTKRWRLAEVVEAAK
jgi:small subunit ribosomal protein S17